jgi:hypothetical protein
MSPNARQESEARYLDRWDRESEEEHRGELARLARQAADRKRRGRAMSRRLAAVEAAVLKSAGTSRAELDRELDADFTAARKAAAAEVKDLRRALADRRKELRLVLREVLALRHRVGEGGSPR